MEKKYKKINLVFLIAVILILIINAIIYFVYRNTTTQGANIGYDDNKLSIIIDPGHGGMDSGAVNKYGENEAPINLQISKKLMLFLDSMGFEVQMTRYSNDGLYAQSSNTTIREKKNEDLKKRIDIINNSNADLVISIHLNSFTQSQYYGAQTFYKKGCEESKIIAKVLQENLKEVLDSNNKRVPQVKSDVKVIDNSNIPIVLVECGFVSNPEEGKILSTSDYQEKIAWAIFKGLIEYIENNKQ